MHTLEELRAALEDDLAWREAEIRLLERFLPDLEYEKEKALYRKALVFTLYAHFEGFFKSSFRLYVEYLNNAQIPVFEAVDSLQASHLNQGFIKYDSQLNTADNPDDKAAFNINRRVYLLKQIHETFQPGKNLSLDNSDGSFSVISTESNLTKKVIQKFFNRLAIDATVAFETKDLEKYLGVIDKLTGLRGGIAHGDIKSKQGVNSDDYAEFKNVFERITSGIPRIITNIITHKTYKKPEYRQEA